MEPTKPTDESIDKTIPGSAPPLPADQPEHDFQPASKTSTQAEIDPPAKEGNVNELIDAPNVLEPTKVAVVGPRKNIFRRLAYACQTHKKTSITAAAIILILVSLFVVPSTRYKLLGLVLSNSFSVTILDATTQKPVTNATVTLGSKATKTDNKGHATLRIKVGHQPIKIDKKYYRSTETTVIVPVLRQKNDWRIFVQATGRQVPVRVVNVLTGNPVENAMVRAADTEARTNGKGEATLVLPADKATLSSTVSANNFNTHSATITVTEQTDSKNIFALTPAGKLYFLSNLSGRIDVVKTNLDGTERQTVLAGTGNETIADTVLLASRDWKYLALKAKRDNTLAKMYVLDTTTDKLTAIDEGNATFTPVGWYGTRFNYVTYSNNSQNWQPNAQALKSYDASIGKLTVIDQTTAEGTGQYDYAYTNFSSVYILNNELVYTQNWYASANYPNRLDGKNVSLYSARPDGTAKKTIKDFAIPSGTQYNYFVNLVAYEPQGLYIQVPQGTSNAYYSYENTKLIATSSVNDDKFYNANYPTFLLSPSGKKTFWAEPRDGKNTLFVGDAAGQNGKQVVSLSQFTSYGWYSDDYLLVSKNGSELYVLPVTGGTAIKVTDYHKPAFNFQGYGYGYGGL